MTQETDRTVHTCQAGATRVEWWLARSGDTESSPLITTRRGKVVCSYYLDPIECSFGVARTFRKVCNGAGTDPEEAGYDVLVAGEESCCSCKGFYRHGWCLHLEILRQIAGEEIDIGERIA